MKFVNIGLSYFHEDGAPLESFLVADKSCPEWEVYVTVKNDDGTTKDVRLSDILGLAKVQLPI